MTYSSWDDSEFPLAYLITFRTYGTWLHGDDRRSVDRHGQNRYNTPLIQPNERLLGQMTENLLNECFLLTGPQRRHVDAAIREVCDFKRFALRALNVRTNHAHVVLSARSRPEPIATAFKAYATRRLRQENLIPLRSRVWSRGESTRYLWKQKFVERAIDYVLNGQGESLPSW
jgi:REP element-mobilizing transposase RayT